MTSRNPFPARLASGRGSLLDSFTAACLAAGGAVCLVSCFFFLFRTYPQYLHSDSAGIVLLTDEILRTGQWLPRSWHYVSDSIWILDGPQVALPFVAAWGPSALALACAASCAAIVFLISTVALGRAAGLPKGPAAIAALFAVSGASMIYSDVVLGMMMTVSLSISALMLLTAVTALRAKRYTLPSLVCAATLALLFATNPRKALVLGALPLLGALMVCAYCARDIAESEHFRERGRFLLVASFVACCAGALAHALLLPTLRMDDSYARFYPSLDLATAVADNARTFGRLLLMFLGIGDDGYAPGAAQTAIRWHRAVSALTMPTLFAAGAVLAYRRKNLAALVFAVFSIGAAALVTLALLTGESIKEYYGIYYLIYAAVPCVVVAFYCVSAMPRWARNAILLAIVAPALLLSARNHVFGDPGYLGPGIAQRTSHAQKTELMSWLEHEGLRYGYSVFWEANAITVLSNGRIHVIPASIRHDVFEPFRWWVSEREIAKAAAQRPAFIAIPRAGKAQVTDACAQGAAVHELKSYRVYVFRDGVAHCLPNGSAATNATR